MGTKLSERATTYLATKERAAAIVEPEKIALVFAKSNAPIFPPLIDFQQQFGGYIFHAGTDSIRFDLIQQKPGSPGNDINPFVEFTRSEKHPDNYKFICASSENLIQFELDEKGQYYEDGKPVARSFSKMIEHMALHAEMKNREGFQQIGSRTNKDEEQVIKSNGVEIIPEASDDITQWYKSETKYLEIVLGVMTLFGRVEPEPLIEQ